MLLVVIALGIAEMITGQRLQRDAVREMDDDVLHIESVGHLLALAIFDLVLVLRIDERPGHAVPPGARQRLADYAERAPTIVALDNSCRIEIAVLLRLFGQRRGRKKQQRRRDGAHPTAPPRGHCSAPRHSAAARGRGRTPYVRRATSRC